MDTVLIIYPGSVVRVRLISSSCMSTIVIHLMVPRCRIVQIRLRGHIGSHPLNWYTCNEEKTEFAVTGHIQSRYPEDGQGKRLTEKRSHHKIDWGHSWSRLGSEQRVWTAGQDRFVVVGQATVSWAFRSGRICVLREFSDQYQCLR